MEAYFEIKMERLNFGKTIFRNIPKVEEQHDKRRGEQENNSAFQSHPRRNLIDASSPDNVNIPHNVIILDAVFKFIYHVGCAINVHSIINPPGLILRGQILSNRILFACGSYGQRT